VAVEHPHPRLDDLASALKVALSPATVHVNQPLARYTALRIGGPADLLAVAGNAEMLRRIVTMAWDYGVPCRVLGAGSNVLVSDAGVYGLIVLNRARSVRIWTAGQGSSHPAVGSRRGPGTKPKGQDLAEAGARVESGVSLSTLARQSVARSLAGLEWAVGIPGTVGGAVVGNAGAWGGDVASTLVQARVLEPDGSVAAWPVERFSYGYRSSVLKRQAPAAVSSGKQAVILEAEFALQAGERGALEARIADITARRKASQPPGASCGSVFKNPPGDHAGRLIEAAGLKGRRQGGAEISPVHANFIVNLGQATASDVMALLEQSQQAVHSQFGVALELEIECIGAHSASAHNAADGDRVSGKSKL
jgi:UDP-N-acetylmuramate dehydrogenase